MCEWDHKVTRYKEQQKHNSLNQKVYRRKENKGYIPGQGNVEKNS